MMKSVDVIVIGSGAAGLVAATEAAMSGRDVLVLSKGQVGRSGATVTVTGDISVDGRSVRRVLGLPGNEADSEEAFFDDTMTGGSFLNHRGLAQAMVTEVAGEVKALLDSGLKVVGIGHAPGHRFPRGVLVSGMQMLQILSRKAAAAKVRFREEFYATDLITSRDGVSGGAGVDLRTGQVNCIQAAVVILATGGGAMVHPFRTAPEELVGDGYRMALRAGAEVIDMEMMQFLPCCLVNPPLWRGIQFPWIIGPQSGTRAWLLNRYGERFMARYDPERMEMSTRDIVSIACVREVLEGRGGPGGGVYMSWAHLPQDILDFLPQWYGKPLLRSSWHWEGFDFAPLVERIKKGYAVEVAPAAHFHMGGVLVDGNCATSVPGLFACGEVAGGVHGANRLSGNACSQFLVQGRQAGRAAAAYVATAGKPSVGEAAWRDVTAELQAPLLAKTGVAPHEFTERVQQIANRALSVVRSGSELENALAEIRALMTNELPRLHSRCKDAKYNRNWIDALEARSAALTVEAMALSALRREESRGAHFREDFPEPDEDCRLNGILSLSGQELMHRTARVPAD